MAAPYAPTRDGAMTRQVMDEPSGLPHPADMPFFTTTNGVRLCYEDYGSGAPFVLLAGWSLGAEMWEYQVPVLVDHGHRCVLPERRGHGRSDRPAAGYDLDTRADDVAALIEHLDLRSVILVGHSVGGTEAAAYLDRYGPDRVAGVAYVAAGLPAMRRTEDNPEGLPEEHCAATIAQLRRDRPKWFADRAQGFFATHLGNDVSPALVDHALRQCMAAAPYALVEVLRTNYAADLRDALRRSSVPTLVVHGAADQSSPVGVTGRHTARLVPGCVYREYPTAGHGLYVTHRDQLNDDLLALARRAARDRVTAATAIA